MRRNGSLEGTETDAASRAARHPLPDSLTESNPREEAWHLAEVGQETAVWADMTV